MSFVNAHPEALAAAAGNLQTIGSALSAQNAAAAAPTTGVVPAAADEVSALTAAQFAYQTGSGLIGAGLVGLVAAGAAFGVLALLFDSLRSPILRLAVALIFAAPAAVAEADHG